MKKIKIIWILVLSFLISLKAVAAQNIGETIGSMFYRLFGWIFIDISGMLGGAMVQFSLRFMVWVLLFAAFYYAISRFVFKDANKGVKITVPLILSLMATLLIPGQVLINVMTTYSGIGAVLLFMVPVAGFLYLNQYAFKGHSRATCALKAVSMYLIATIFHNMVGIQAAIGMQNLDQWAGFAESIALIAMILYLWCAIVGKGEDSGGGEDGGGQRGEGNRNNQGGRGNRRAGQDQAIPAQTPPPQGSAAYPQITSINPNTGQVQARVRRP